MRPEGVPPIGPSVQDELVQPQALILRHAKPGGLPMQTPTSSCIGSIGETENGADPMCRAAGPGWGSTLEMLGPARVRPSRAHEQTSVNKGLSITARCIRAVKLDQEGLTRSGASPTTTGSEGLQVTPPDGNRSEEERGVETPRYWRILVKSEGPS